MLEDIAALTGGQVVSEELGHKLETIDDSFLGQAKKIIVTKDDTTIVEGQGKKDDIQGRIAQLRRQIDDTTSDYDREKLQERLARMAGGVGVIAVGAATEVEMKEKKDRVDDALHATQAAVKEGVLPGGGVALIRCVDVVRKAAEKQTGDVKTGMTLVIRALYSPLRQIVQNSGEEDGSVIVQEVEKRKGNEGYNALTGEFCDMIKSGILDPTKVVRCALENAASIAGMLLTTEAIVSDIPEPAGAGAPAGMGGGMDY